MYLVFNNRACYFTKNCCSWLSVRPSYYKTIVWCWLRCTYAAWLLIQLWVLLHVHKVMCFCLCLFQVREFFTERKRKKKTMNGQLREARDVAVAPMSLVWLGESTWNTRSREMHVCCFEIEILSEALSPCYFLAVSTRITRIFRGEFAETDLLKRLVCVVLHLVCGCITCKVAGRLG